MMSSIWLISLLASASVTVAFIHYHPLSQHLHERNSIVILSEKKSSSNSDDFPTWLKALTKWDTTTQDTTATTSRSFPFTSRKKIWEEEMSPLVASLSGMANIEALVNVANETTNIDDDEMDLLPDIDDLKRSLLFSDKSTNTKNGKEEKQLFPFLDNALRFDEFAKSLKELTDLIPSEEQGLNVTFEELVSLVPNNDLLSGEEMLDEASSKSKSAVVVTPEKILQEATQRLDFLINGTSYAFNPSAFQSLIVKASKAIETSTSGTTSILEQAGKAPAEYTRELVTYANNVINEGYTPLFSNYPSVKSIPIEQQGRKVVKAAEYATLSSAIYEEDALPKTHAVRHSVVAQGKTADIGWMITDSLQYEKDYTSDKSEKKPTLVRTFVLRGYDASDEEVDREGLLNVICTATPVPILLRNEKPMVQVHEGMLSMAEELFKEFELYIDMTSSSHKVVLTGHSIGGSLAILLMILLRNGRGASFVKQNILRVFTFGSPPIFEILDESASSNLNDSCSILDAFDLPTDIVYSYNQPWDPIPRLYTKYDPLYPLIDDLGDDGYTPWVSGPPRTLRPILKTILESWEGWPQYRDNARVKLGQDFRSVGEQYLLLPEVSPESSLLCQVCSFTLLNTLLTAKTHSLFDF